MSKPTSELRDNLQAAIIENGMLLGHKELPDFFKSIGLPEPTCHEGTKREKLETSFSQVPLEQVPVIANAYLEKHCNNPDERNNLQDLLWAGSSVVKINKKLRRKIAMLIGGDFYEEGGDRGFDALLNQLWVLEDPSDIFAFVGSQSKSLKDQIDQHIHRNPGDWGADDLFQELGAYEAPDYRFCLFLEGLASDAVRPEEASQRAFVKQINPILTECGAQFVECGNRDGYPVFKIEPIHTKFRERPKNIIFASQEKPDLRLSDAISNNVQVLSNRDKVLVYDRPIPTGGLVWEDLQDWWKESNCIKTDEEAKTSLYSRLKSSLPDNSPPQLNFFLGYHKHFRNCIPRLPALLPEVWLYWDPKTIEQRGSEALKNLRMDFLLLLPGMIRIVIEVDGRHHYSDSQGAADPKKYAELASGDRDMKLLGYDIYRFGGSELGEESNSISVVGSFFDKLFKKYDIKIPSS